MRKFDIIDVTAILVGVVLLLVLPLHVAIPPTLILLYATSR